MSVYIKGKVTRNKRRWNSMKVYPNKRETDF